MMIQILIKWLWVCAVLCCSSLTSGQAPTEESPTCSAAASMPYTSPSTTSLKYNTTALDWQWRPAGGDEVMVAALSMEGANAVAETLRNRRLLFVGDSTVRNAIIAAIGSTCNTEWTQCAQMASWGARHDVAGIGGSSDERADVKSVLTCGAVALSSSASSGNQCAKRLSIRVVPIVNLTSERLPRSKRERKWMWKSGTLPPLVRVSLLHLNATVDVIEAGCAGGGDGLWLVFRHLLKTAKYAENVTASHHLFGETTRDAADHVDREFGYLDRSTQRGVTLYRAAAPVMRRYDAVFTSAGLHCNYKHYRAGMWYRDLKRHWPEVTRFTPVVWMEIAHCLKDNTGHFFTWAGKQRLNYKKLASCPFIDSHVPTMNKLFSNITGMFVSPTRFISRGLKKQVNASGPPSTAERRNSSCLYADYLHPGLLCYAAMNLGHMAVLRDAFAWKERRLAAGCLATKDAEPGPNEAPTADSEGAPPLSHGKTVSVDSTTVWSTDSLGWPLLITCGVGLLPLYRVLRRRSASSR